MDQIRSQAADDESPSTETAPATPPATLFDQVANQAADDEADTPDDSKEDSGSAGEASAAAPKESASLATGTPEASANDTPEQKTAPQPATPDSTKAASKDVVGEEDPVKKTFRGKKLPKQDDLKIVEGIGPKIEQLFQADGIKTWLQLSEADPERLRKILQDAGPRYRMHNPDTWPRQAGFAHEGNWEELEAYQDHLDGGREPGS